MTNTPQLISIVVPLYCEEDVIEEFHRRTAGVMDVESSYAFEVIYVNDGSTDRTRDKLDALASRDPRARVINLSRNFGHQIAITAGIDHARGDAVVLIDGDLQDPPEVIPRMIMKWKEGFEVVYAVREKRKGETLFKRLTALIFYRVLERLGEIRVPRDTGDFRLIDRKVVQSLQQIREDNRYLRGLVSWVGFRQTGLYYERDARYAGTTKFRLFKMLKFAWDGVTSFSERPLHLSAHLGLLVTAGSVIEMLWILTGKLLRPETVVQGWTSTMLAVLFLGGVQLVSIGILGQYVGRIYRETKNRPLYLIADKRGFDPSTE